MLFLLLFSFSFGWGRGGGERVVFLSEACYFSCNKSYTISFVLTPKSTNKRERRWSAIFVNGLLRSFFIGLIGAGKWSHTIRRTQYTNCAVTVELTNQNQYHSVVFSIMYLKSQMIYLQFIGHFSCSFVHRMNRVTNWGGKYYEQLCSLSF